MTQQKGRQGNPQNRTSSVQTKSFNPSDWDSENVDQVFR